MQVTVRVGMTVSGLALRYHTTVGAIAEANHLQDPDFIRIGQKLQIPGGKDNPIARVAPDPDAAADKLDGQLFDMFTRPDDGTQGAATPGAPVRRPTPAAPPVPAAPTPATQSHRRTPPTGRPSAPVYRPGVSTDAASAPAKKPVAPSTAPTAPASEPKAPAGKPAGHPHRSVGSTTHAGAPANRAHLSEADINALVRAVAAEARGEDARTQAGVAQAIINYSRRYGISIPSLVRSSYLSSNFDGNRMFYHLPMMAIPNQKGIRAAVMQAADFRSPVGSRTHFHDTSISTPGWGNRQTRVQVGHMVFYDAL